MTDSTQTSRRKRASRGAKGYDVLPNGTCRVRVSGFPTEYVDDELDAQLRVAELRKARSTGLALPAPAGAKFRTLGDSGRSFLAHKLASGGRHGELTASGADHWRRVCRPWIEGPLAAELLSTLRREQLQTAIDARTITNRTSARNETEGLLAILKHAQADDVPFPASLLAVKAPRKTRRSRPQLTTTLFDTLIAYADARQVRLLELASTLANRINELLLLERGWVDLDRRRITIPLEATKEKREKVLDLTDDEVELVRAQLLDVYQRLGPDTRYVFPRPGGTRWSRSSFAADVWRPAKRLAMIEHLRTLGHEHADRLVDRRLELQGLLQRRGHDAKIEAELATLPSTPFDAVTLHTLRRTAVAWLRRSGLPVEIIAQRLGHNDRGATLLREYRNEATAAEVRAALDELGTGVRAHLRKIDGEP